MSKEYDESKYKVAKEVYNSGDVFTGMTVDGDEITNGFPTREQAENELVKELKKTALMKEEEAKKDYAIKLALLDAESKGKLGVVAAVTAVQGGEKRLREIMKSDQPLGFFERTVLVMHLSA